MVSDIYREVSLFALDWMCGPEASILAPSGVWCDVYVYIKELIYFSISKPKLELNKPNCIHKIEYDQKGHTTTVLIAPLFCPRISTSIL